MLDGARVLVLNQTYEPIHVCNGRRAIRMVLLGKAVSIENDGLLVRSESFHFRLPAVIRLLRFVHIPRTGEIPFSKKNIWRRDNYTCQYCGRNHNSLTLDHVLPRRLGGKHTWENLVAACPNCNHRKGGRTLEEAHLRLIGNPYAPDASAEYIYGRYLNINQEWQPFIQGW